MNTYPPYIEDAKLEALKTSVDNWARRARWSLSGGIERMGPCPVCGGKDRFSINTSKNKWNCRQREKGGSDVISLVMHTEGLDFKKALAQITRRQLDPNAQETDAEKTARQKRITDAHARSERDRIKQEAANNGYRESARKAGYEDFRSASKMWRGPESVLRGARHRFGANSHFDSRTRWGR